MNVCTLCTADNSANLSPAHQGENGPAEERTFADSTPIQGNGADQSTSRFISLIPGSDGFYQDGPVVMRVRMPYSAIESLGMSLAGPVGGQPAGFVNADLLVGSDGTTRAIRFVQ